MNIKLNIYVANDSPEANEQYRSGLISEIIGKGHDVHLISFWQLFKLRLIKRREDVLISSNIRTNIITLALFYSNVRIILNGLGRYRKKKAFRVCIGMLMSIGKRKIFIQNYSDFRYFRRFFNVLDCEWVPGSGAEVRVTHVNDGFFNVNRNNKFHLCSSELSDFLNLFPCVLNVVGVSQKQINSSINVLGRVEQSQILSYGNKFVWLGGYGDGFPHSLADALFNGIETYISKREYIRLGIYKLSKNVRKIDSWYILPPQSFNELQLSEVNRMYTVGL